MEDFFFSKATTMHYNNIIQKKYVLPKPIKLSNMYLTHQTI